ncbi:hypothetical protein MP228_004374 [Amoeboaphelidium protococcarum]|nr:hypothetical protein MP228_004374 [Amoeboaphelidium protococcarum]
MFAKLAPKKKVSEPTPVAPVSAQPGPSVQQQTQQVPAQQQQQLQQQNQSSSSPKNLNGILLVRVVEAQGLSVDAGNTQMPYMVIDFDKNEFLAESTGGSVTSPKWSQRANFDVSREAEIMISVYQRTNAQMPKMPTPSLSNQPRKQTSRAPIQPAQQTLLLGTCRMRPKFTDQKPEEQVCQLISANGSIAGEIQVQLLFRVVASKKSLSIDDFDLMKVIGKGSFGKVMQVRKKDTGRIYAMKIIRKASIVERSEVEHTLAERNVLAKIQSPFIVNLKFSFQSPDKLYLVLAFVNGGELFHHLQSEGCFHEERAKFYAAELLLALETLHMYNIIYRDLKPENILLDYTGHIALCDFGLCKLNMTKDEKTNTFCGTPEYLAPELLIGNGYTKVVDWWTLGVLLYEMIVGLPPFYSENTNEMYRKILNDPLRFPRDDGSEGPVVSPLGKDLLSKLLNRDANARLGFDGPGQIKSHPFFSNVDWHKLERKMLNPPFRPQVSSAMDTSNFSEEFTSEAPSDSFVENPSALSSSVQDQFQGFTYIGNENNAMYGTSIRTGQTFVNRGPLG